MGAITESEARIARKVEAGDAELLRQVKGFQSVRGSLAQSRLELQAPLSARRWLDLLDLPAEYLESSTGSLGPRLLAGPDHAAKPNKRSSSFVELQKFAPQGGVANVAISKEPELEYLMDFLEIDRESAEVKKVLERYEKLWRLEQSSGARLSSTPLIPLLPLQV